MATQPDFYGKRFDGRDETILDPEMPIVDAHVHLVHRPDLNYMLDDLIADLSAGHRIAATVYIENGSMYRTTGPELLRSLGEIEYANGLGAMGASGVFGPTRFCAAIVGYAPVDKGDSVAELLDRALAVAPDRLRAVRQMAFFHPSEIFQSLPLGFPEGILSSASFLEGYRHVGSRGLSYEACVFHNQLGEVRDLADAFPETQLVVGHMGMAFGLGLDRNQRHEVFLDWRKSMQQIAERPNTLCKIGGLGLLFWGFGFEGHAGSVSSGQLAEVWQPYVEAVIEAFGPERCMMESNFPEDGPSCGYVPSWNALKLCTRGYSAEERAAMFHNNAARFYRIDLPE